MTASERVQLLIELGYDGRRFYGVTPQPGLPTVADALTARIEAAFGVRPRALVFAARTDRWVRARHNLATCWLPPGTPAESGLQALRLERADGLTAVRARQVAPHVFARGISTGKRYSYTVETGWTDAREHPGAWRIWPALDPDRMRAAAAHLRGTHDFRAFAARHPPQRSGVRTVTRLDWAGGAPGPHPRWILHVHGDGFLRRMVRTLAGTLVECGVGLRDPDSLPALLASRDREQAGICAPGGGLCLEEVLTAAG